MTIFSIPSRLLGGMFLYDTRVVHLAFLKRQWAKGLCVFFLTLAMISQISKHVSLVYSQTNSLPHHLFLNLKNVTPKRGDYTCFESPWYGGRLIKKVVGMGGDSLAYDDEGNLWVEILWVGRQLKVGKHKKKAKDGRPLTPLKAGVIPKGMVFVMGNHERSFDSRYEELGLIPQRALQGRLLPLV